MRKPSIPGDVTDLPASDVRTSLLVEWLYEAAKGGVQPKGMRRLCWLAAEKLTIEVTTGELPDGKRTTPTE